MTGWLDAKSAQSRPIGSRDPFGALQRGAMQQGNHHNSRRGVRIAAIALVILGAFAFRLDHARAQLGLDTLRSVVDKAKAGKAVPGKDVLRGKSAPNLKGQVQKGQSAKDAISKVTKNKGALEKFTKGDKAKDLIARDKLREKFGKGPADRVTDKLGKDKLGGKDRLSKDALTKDKLGGKDKLSKDALTKDKLGGKDKLSKDALTKDKLGKDKLGKGERAKDKLGGKDKLGKGELTKGKDKAGETQIRQGQDDADKRAATKIAQAKNPVDRGKIRLDHRRDINVARVRMPPRPFPGAAGFTGVPPPTETRYVSTEMVFQAGPNVIAAAGAGARATPGRDRRRLQPMGLTGGVLYHIRVTDNRRVSDEVRTWRTSAIGVAQPNYVYQNAAGAAAVAAQRAAEPGQALGDPGQYVIEKLRLGEVHRRVRRANVLVAVINSTDRHQASRSRGPDRRGIRRRRQGAATPHAHGTGMTGAIAAQRKLLGIAPGARILAVRAFRPRRAAIAAGDHTPHHRRSRMGDQKGARVINMSFAGPHDPMLAAGDENAARGRGADRGLRQRGREIAAALSRRRSARDRGHRDRSRDKLMPVAVRGPHVAISAPGVDIMVPAPDDTYSSPPRARRLRRRMSAVSPRC